MNKFLICEFDPNVKTTEITDADGLLIGYKKEVVSLDLRVRSTGRCDLEGLMEASKKGYKLQINVINPLEQFGAQ